LDFSVLSVFSVVNEIPVVVLYSLAPTTLATASMLMASLQQAKSRSAK
jgi:hypothetical protein